jgi:NAD(P)-dependent dehydrogenase (short-subunit alcohol dehydrogenase family)
MQPSGIIQLTGRLLQDGANYAKKGIRVNAVCPGYTDTPMIRMPGAGPSVGMDDYLKVCPMGRLGEAREVSRKRKEEPKQDLVQGCIENRNCAELTFILDCRCYHFLVISNG